MFGCEKTEQGMVLAMTCLTERMSPLQFRNTYHLIGGNVTMRSDAMLAKFRILGGKHDIVERSATRAAARLYPIGGSGESVVFSFTWEEAQVEPFPWSNKVDKHGNPIPKKNWATPRARMQMLWARVVSDGVRAMAPEINFGVYTPEEHDDGEAGSSQPSRNGGASILSPVSNVPPTPATGEGEQPPAVVDVQPPFSAKADESGKLNEETRHRVAEAIGNANLEMSWAWFVAHKWLADGQTLADLSAQHAQWVLDRPAAFLDAVSVWENQQGGAK